MTTNNIKI